MCQGHGSLRLQLHYRTNEHKPRSPQQEGNNSAMKPLIKDLMKYCNLKPPLSGFKHGQLGPQALPQVSASAMCFLSKASKPISRSQA